MNGLFGYEMKTTFWLDFSIAEAFESKENGAIQDTFNRAFNEWRDNVVFVTELSLVMNWKCWYWYEHDNEKWSQLYEQLYETVNDWCYDNLKGDDLDYYWQTTD